MSRLAGPKVLLLYADDSGCSLFRAWWPVTALKRQFGYPCWTLHRDNDALPDYAWQTDALVLCRLSWATPDREKGRRWVDSLHAAGKAVLFECDDDVFTPASLPQTSVINDEGKSWAELDQERLDRIYALQLCDGVTVASQRLATVVRQFTDNPVQVVPNALAWADFQRVCQAAPRTVDGLTIGWVGGKRLDHDFAAMVTAWGRIARRYPAVTFVVGGYHAPALLDAVPPERLVLQPWLPARLFPRAYRDLTDGILCCPLADVPFNRAKTPVKALEGAAAGAAVVASPTVYGQVMRDGKDGYLVQTADEWERALARLIEDAAHRRQMAARWARRVRERHSLEQTAYRWPQAWGALVDAYRARQRTRLWVPA